MSASTIATQSAVAILSSTSADPVLMETYKEEFTKHYGHNRAQIKPKYKHGQFDGYKVKVDDGNWYVMAYSEVAGAIAQFRK